MFKSHTFFFLSISGLILVNVAYAESTTIFSDDFNRADSSTVGNDWVEYEPGVESDPQIVNNELYMQGKNDKFEPCVSHVLTTPSSTANNSTMKWSFKYNFEYDDFDKYSIFFDLGNNIQCGGSANNGTTIIRLEQFTTNTSIENWIWYQNATGAEFAAAKINGTTTIEVVAYQNTGTYDLSFLNGTIFDGSPEITDIPFDNATEIDSIRIMLSRLTTIDWISKTIDDIVITNYDSCGITVPSGLDFGSVTPNGASTNSDEVSFQINSTGTMTSSVTVSATNWLTVAADVNMIDGERTRFGFTEGQSYNSKTKLSTSDLVSFADIPGESINTSYWQAKPMLNNESFAGDVYQNMTFVATCS